MSKKSCSMYLCMWLFSLSMFIHLVACICMPFLFMAEQYSIVCIYHTLFIYSLVDGHCSFFHLLAIVNKSVMNIHAQVFVWVSVFNSFGYIPRNAGQYANSMFNFLSNHQTVFYNGCTILHSYQQSMRVLVFLHPCQYLLFSIKKNYSHSDGYKC